MRKALMLRTCEADMTVHGGFKWPESGPVEAPDWRDDDGHGGGLHGLLWGEGEGTLLSWEPDARWLVIEVDEAEVRDLGGEVKVPRGIVVHCGDRGSATRYIAENGGASRAIVGYVATTGHGGPATTGNFGTATAGHYGVAIAGEGGMAAAGNRGTLVIAWHDGSRRRLAVGYVGEGGIKPGVAYRVEDGTLVEDMPR